MEPRYVWSPQAGRYRERSSGRFVSATQVHAWLVETTANAGRSMRELTQQLRVGTVDIRSWQLEMTQNIRLAHMSNAAAVIAGAVAHARRGNRREMDWLRHGPGFWWCLVTPAHSDPESIRAFAVGVVTDGSG